MSRDSISLRANYVLQSDLRNLEAMCTFTAARQSLMRALSPGWCAYPDWQIIGAATFERCVRAWADKVQKVVDAFDQALGSVMKRLVAWTLRTPPSRLPIEDAPYDIGKYRNPTNAVIDSENCPKGSDASMVPITDE